MTKSALRKIFREKRQKLSAQEYQHLNELLCGIFVRGIDLTRVTLLHTFLPLTHNHEPDTWPMINHIRQQRSHIQIAVPRISLDGQLLETVVLEPGSKLQPNRWGIPEPVDGLLIDPQELDVVLVPLLAFDRLGNRVGYGKGFYDNFLPRCRPDCGRIGVSFFDPVDEISDTDAYDQKLTAAITPQELIVF
jgi:5-formyltetrahydrofolate cyclo-ligase